MKFIAFACLGLLTHSVKSLIASSPLSQTNCDLPEWFHPDNHVVNGDFENTQFPKGKSWILTNQIPGWQVIEGEIGFGKLYNKNWQKDTKVIELDAVNVSRTEFISKLQLQQGKYSLVFRYAARHNKPLKTSKFSVKFNGQTIKKIEPQNYNLNCVNIILEAHQGLNQLRFVEEGADDSLGATIDNVIVTGYKDVNNPQIVSKIPVLFAHKEDVQLKKACNQPKLLQPTKIFGPNLIFNSGFQEQKLPGNKSWMIVGDFPGWSVIQGQIGYGRNYNPEWDPQTQVIELDGHKNMKYQTTLELDQNQYVVSFDWAARSGKNLQTSEFQVQFNGDIIFDKVPHDQHVHHEVIYVKGVKGMNKYAFIGKGQEDSLGVTIDNVTLKQVIYQNDN